MITQVRQYYKPFEYQDAFEYYKQQHHVFKTTEIKVTN